MLVCRMQYHPMLVCDQAGDQRQEEVPGCLSCEHITEAPFLVNV